MFLKISVIVVDDERPAREEILDLLKNYPDIEVLAVCKNAFEAQKEIEKYQPDVIFLDIAMPQKNGFELLAELRVIPLVVFITAYDQFALKAFEEKALDYLLKPVQPARLDKTIYRLRNQLNEMQPPSGVLFRNLFIRDRDHFFIVKLHDVFLIEAYGNYVRLHYHQKSVLQNYTLKEALLLLPSTAFARINRNQIINVAFIEEVTPASSRRLKLRLKNGRPNVYTSSRRSQEVRSLLGMKNPL